MKTCAMFPPHTTTAVSSTPICKLLNPCFCRINGQELIIVRENDCVSVGNHHDYMLIKKKVAYE